MATFAYLLLDADNDPVFDPGAQLTDAQAVAQAILTNLRLLQGEWWENLNIGLPLFQSILGQPGSQNLIALAQSAITAQIQATPYVLNVLNVVCSFSDGQLSYTANVQTAFGTVTVTNQPGNAAALNE